MKTPRFLYFDLGKVLLDFDVEVMLRQIGEAAGIDPMEVRRVLFELGLQKRYESGEVTSREFYDEFCRETNARPDYDELAHAGSAIFEVNESMVPVVSALYEAGCELGILSNTCEAHWDYCLSRFDMLEELFSPHALSYRIGASKPDQKIYATAAEMVGRKPEDIFFVDDLQRNVDGALAAGFDAVLYESAEQVASELRLRGLEFQL